MTKITQDVREANDDMATGMVETGVNLLGLALMFGGSAFFLKWAIWFVVVGLCARTVIAKGADAVDWAWEKIPAAPWK